MTSGEQLTITSSGIWTGWSGPTFGPDGYPTNYAMIDRFYTGAPHGALIAFVGRDPYQGQWGNSNYFPQPTGYWDVGTSNRITADHSGELWLGFNDDAVSQGIGDNTGSVTATLGGMSVFLSNGLVSYYPLDGNANDVLGNGNVGVLENGAYYTNGIAGAPNAAIYCDGANGYVIFGKNDAVYPNQVLTWSAWFRPEQYDGMIFWDDDSQAGGDRYIYLAPDGSLKAGSFGSVASATPVTLDDWHEAVFSSGLNGQRLYLDGRLIASDPNIIIDHVGRSSVSIGAGNDTGGGPNLAYASRFKGEISKVRIYNQSLSSSDVEQLFLREAFGNDYVPASTNLWDISQGVLITDHSQLFACGCAPPGNGGPALFDARDIFGAHFGNHADFRDFTDLVFNDGEPVGFTNYVEWSMPLPVTVESFDLYATGDGYPGENINREFAAFTLKARSPASQTFDRVLYSFVPPHPYVFINPTNRLLLAADIVPITAQDFRAEFVTGRGVTGPLSPRIISLRAFGNLRHSTGYFTPERSAFSTVRGFRMRLNSVSSGHVNVQASTNLIDWSDVVSFPDLQGTLEFIEPSATNFARRFYRAVSPR